MYHFTTGKKTYVYEISLISRMQVMDHRSLIEMRELGHVVRLVEFGRIDFIDAFRLHFSFTAIFALDNQSTIVGLFNNPSLYKGQLRIS